MWSVVVCAFQGKGQETTLYACCKFHLQGKFGYGFSKFPFCTGQLLSSLKNFFLRFTLNLHILVHVGPEEDREGGIRTQGDSVKDGCE